MVGGQQAGQRYVAQRDKMTVTNNPWRGEEHASRKRPLPAAGLSSPLHKDEATAGAYLDAAAGAVEYAAVHFRDAAACVSSES